MSLHELIRSGSFAQIKDALGSAVALVDSSGTIQTTYTYDPFGNTSVSGTANGNKLQYTGRENEGSGLYFYRARFYSPLLERFISEDRLVFWGGGINAYVYVGDDPVDFDDPSGFCKVQVGHHTPYGALPNEITFFPIEPIGLPPIPPLVVTLPQHTYLILSDVPLNGRYTKAVFSAYADRYPLPFRPAMLESQVGIGDLATALGNYKIDPLDTVTEDDGHSCVADLNTLSALAASINQRHIEYGTARGPNSNSATNAGLKALGLDWTPSYPAPGWSKPLGVK